MKRLAVNVLCVPSISKVSNINSFRSSIQQSPKLTFDQNKKRRLLSTCYNSLEE